jgi:CheY-like chemotaxis protein
MNISHAVEQDPRLETEHQSKKSAATILVVEDEVDLLDLVSQVLESRGYRVFSANSGQQAMDFWNKHGHHIDLLLTDMLMPDGTTGFKLSEQMRADTPDLRVIYTSGHTAGVPGTQLADVDERYFLGKPYRPSELLEIVQDCLENS